MRRVPFVPSPYPVVRRMLEVAGVRRGEVVLDLGAGDGRILVEAVRRYEAYAVGVEDNPKRILLASRNIERSGVSDKARLLRQNLLEADLKSADVVTLYLLPEINRVLLPKIVRELKPSARIVTHDFPLPSIKPVRKERLNHNGVFHYVYLYELGDQLAPMAKKF
ncbi:MAG: class I SAM-dependent methyltransferase [Thermoprotei archaeon]